MAVMPNEWQADRRATWALDVALDVSLDVALDVSLDVALNVALDVDVDVVDVDEKSRRRHGPASCMYTAIDFADQAFEVVVLVRKQKTLDQATSAGLSRYTPPPRQANLFGADSAAGIVLWYSEKLIVYRRPSAVQPTLRGDRHAQSSLPPLPPPLPPGRLGPLQRFIAPLGLSRTPRQNEDPGPRAEHPSLHTASSISRYGALASQTATHRTGIPISALDINEQKTHAVLAGKEILKTVRIQDGKVTEDFNLRASIISYASTHGSSQPDAATRRREYLSCRDVRWSSKQFSHIIAAAGQNGRIALYDVNVAGARTELAWIHDHTGQVNKLDFDVFVGYMMLSASTDKTVRMTDIRDTRAAKCTQKFVVRSGVRHVAWSPVEGNDFEFAVCADGGLVQHWDARNARGPTLSIHAHERGCYSLDWHPGGRHVVSGGTDRYVRVWDVKGERRQKPVFAFRAPQAIRNVKWRPTSWSPESAETGAWQTTQVATTYQLDDPRLHVWDLRRPTIPFREIDNHSRPASDFLWASNDLIWTCGEEGVFTQNDVNFAPQVHQMCPPSSLQSLPNGDCIFFSEERHHRRPSKGEDPSAAFLSLAPEKPSQGDEVHQQPDFDADDREGVQYDSLLSTSFKRKVRSVPPASAAAAANFSHSGSPQTPDPLNNVLQLNKATKSSTSTFGNDQTGFVGRISGAAPEPELVEFLAHYYTPPPPSERERTNNPDQILARLTACFLNNAHVCAEASMHRMAQSWRILESVIVPELRDWADANRALRKSEYLKIKERREKERQKIKETESSIHSFSKLQARHLVPGSDGKPQKLISYLLGGVTDSDKLAFEHDSTSTMTTPLARPLKDLFGAPRTGHSTSERHDPSDAIEPLPPLPPSVLTSHATAAAAARALADNMGPDTPPSARKAREERLLAGSPGEGADVEAPERILERSPMINTQMREEKRAALRDYRVQARPIFSLDARIQPPQYDQDSRHDSSESFLMFSTSTSSSHKPQSLGQSFRSQQPGQKAGSLQDPAARVDSIGSFSSFDDNSLSKESVATAPMDELRDRDDMDADGYISTDFWPIDLSRLMRPDLAQRVVEGILIDHLQYLQQARLYEAAAALRRSCAELGFERAWSLRAAKPQESRLTGSDDYGVARLFSTTKTDPFRATPSAAVEKTRAALRISSGERATQSGDENGKSSRKLGPRQSMGGFASSRKSVRLVAPSDVSKKPDDANGKEIVKEFVSLLTNFSTSVASNLLSNVTFTDTSDGINFLAGIPLGSVTFNSSQAFIYGQGTQPAIDVNVTAIDTITPDGVITFRWIGHAGLKTGPLSGINVLYASADPAQGGGGSKGVHGWVLTKVFSEFNSAEWVLQIGGNVTL
ncbi:hypothetical protein DV737_g4479, partial [Chaetothyriales sp. CBS 132003]